MKPLTESGSAGTLSVTVGLHQVNIGPPPTLTMLVSQVFAIWMYPGGPLAQNATSEDRFVKIEPDRSGCRRR